MPAPRRRLHNARERLPDALRTLSELRQAIIAGHADTVLLGLVDELQEELYSLEGEVGSAAPLSLFDAT